MRVGKRKVLRIGASMYVSLPKEWTDDMGIEPGDGLECSKSKDGTLHYKKT